MRAFQRLPNLSILWVVKAVKKGVHIILHSLFHIFLENVLTSLWLWCIYVYIQLIDNIYTVNYTKRSIYDHIQQDV